MGEDAEEIIIPTETQRLTSLRRLGLLFFVAVSVVLFCYAIVLSVLR